MRSTFTKILLSLAALGAASVAAIGGTYANFSAAPTTLSTNAFAAGSLSMSRSGSGAIFSVDAAKIGDTAAGSVTITNTGTLAGDYTLSGSTTGSATLAGVLQLEIYKDADGSPAAKIYGGKLAGFSSLDLGTFAASNGAHTYFFHISLPSTGSDAGDNALQGLSTTTSFTWSAVQA